MVDNKKIKKSIKPPTDLDIVIKQTNQENQVKEQDDPTLQYPSGKVFDKDESHWNLRQ